MEVRIGVTHTPKELEVEMTDGVDRAKLLADIEAALSKPDGVLWLTDRRGRSVGVPSARVAYVELGSESDERRVGFGAP